MIFKMYRKGKDIRKNLCDNQLISTYSTAAFVFVHSVFGEKFPTAEFFNDVGRNSLLGNTVERK
jgi:hypothetical protein